MQDVTAEICASTAEGTKATLTDRRDSNTYTVAKINGNCWMTQNLRLSGGRDLTSADSDVTSNWEFPDNSIKADDANYIGNSYTAYTEAGFTISSNTSQGGYYNYCAASAGTVCSRTKKDATQSICPAGWELPTLDQFSGITNQVSAFSPVYSGYYDDGSRIAAGGVGYWWSATANDITGQHYLRYEAGSLDTDHSDKRGGLSVRCVRSS